MSGTSRESDKFMLRLPEGMRERVKASAEANNRSMNSEVVQAIEYYLNRGGFQIDTGPDDPNEYDGSNEDGFYLNDEEKMIRRSLATIEDDLRAFLAKAKLNK